MRHLWLTILLLGICPLLFGQLDSGSLTVTASRIMFLQPDQVAFTASVNAGIDTTLDEILAILAPANVTVASLTAIYSSTQRRAIRLTWNFSWLVPFSKMKDTLTALQPLGRQVSFSIFGASVSADLQSQNRCPASDLLADATGQARKMATAVGATAGPVLALSDGSVGTEGIAIVAGPPSPPGIAFLPASTTLNCSLTVKFKLNQ